MHELNTGLYQYVDKCETFRMFPERFGFTTHPFCKLPLYILQLAKPREDKGLSSLGYTAVDLRVFERT